MPTSVIIVIQWLHVFLGLYWFGAVLYVDTILLPTLSRLELADQQRIGRLIGPRTGKVLTPVAVLVVLLGILRGTVFGGLHSLIDVFGSAYGITWFIALVLGVVLVPYGLLVLTPRANGLATASSPEEYGARVAQLRVLTLIELVIFFALFTCMVLMRFGL